MTVEPAPPANRPLPSLRVHLLLLVLGAVLPGSLLAALLISRTFSTNRAVIERRLLDSARVNAAALDHEFDGVIRAFQALATSPALDEGALEAFYHEARRVQQVEPG